MHRAAVLAFLIACSHKPAPAPANSGGSPASSGAVADESAAIAAVAKVAGDTCATFEVEAKTADGYDIAKREKHADGCPGDPSVAPVVGRYRVTRDGKLSKYDAAEDSWKPM